MTMAETKLILDDLLAPNLDLVLCGTAPSVFSARENAYYAKPGNRFWPVLHEVGLTPYQLSPRNCRDLLKFNIGLTDLCKTHYGNDNQLPVNSFDPQRLRECILKYKPLVLAFDSLNAARIFMGKRPSDVMLGLQDIKIGNSLIFVCCSTSGINSHWKKQKHSWFELAKLIQNIRLN